MPRRGGLQPSRGPGLLALSRPVSGAARCEGQGSGGQGERQGQAGRCGQGVAGLGQLVGDGAALFVPPLVSGLHVL